MKKNRRNRTLLRLVTDAMLIALYVVLSFFLSVRIPPLIKISWASLPLLVAALLFSPADAVAVALCGSFAEQLLAYGISPTTPLWMVPPVLHALFVAAFAPLCRKGKRRARQAGLIAVSEFFLTFTNTAALYLDAKIVGYPVGAIAAVLPPRLLNGAIRAVLSAALIPLLLPPLEKLIRQGGAFRKKAADAEAIAYIHSHQKHSGAAGLSRMRELLEKCNNPQDGMRFIHIAGTNGKGSVSAMTESVLRRCGYHTGLFTSPYLREFNERIRVCGKPIPPRALARLVQKLRPIADAMETPPTEFELITAIGFLYFRERKCDTVVLEVGLGGRLDPTNVIAPPALCVITGIAMDHTAVLGDTIEKIAAEKAGIIKHGTPAVVFGGENEAARRVMEAAAAAAGVPFVAAGDTPVQNAEFTLSGVTLDFGVWRRVSTPLLGIYQGKNLATVLKSVEILQKNGFRLPEKKVRRGLALVRWEGRFEKLSEQPPVFFDGAHNPQGIAAAKESIGCYFPGEKILILTGVMADKDHAEMVRLLAPVARRVFTVTPDNPRALPAEEYAEEWRAAGVEAIACGQPGDALRIALAAAKATREPLFILGSLYLYGPVVAALAASGQ